MKKFYIAPVIDVELLSSHLMVVAGSSNVNVKVQEDDDEYEEDCNGSRLWDWEGEDGEAY